MDWTRRADTRAWKAFWEHYCNARVKSSSLKQSKTRRAHLGLGMVPGQGVAERRGVLIIYLFTVILQFLSYRETQKAHPKNNFQVLW